MSHFPAIVIGPDYERQLAPYHEFECTGVVDEFVQSIDETEEQRGYWEKYRDEGQTFRDYLDGDGIAILPHGEQPDLDGAHKFGWAEVDASGEVVKVVRRTNPNKRWDWYQVGGRWRGYFPLKTGASGALGEAGVFGNLAKPNTADAVRWGDVDIARARAEATEQARAEFAKWRAAFERYGKPKSWVEVREAHPGDIDRAREVYNAQPAVKSMNAWDCPVQEYGFDEDAYLQRSEQKALVPFAVVKDGKWYEKGKMGWWACVSDEKDENVWIEQVAKLFDGLDPETPVTLVDCHI